VKISDFKTPPANILMYKVRAQTESVLKITNIAKKMKKGMYLLLNFFISFLKENFQK
jgi:hypothetical protein